ncbi:unnamed protein product, partial [marine sediment metagenome]
ERGISDIVGVFMDPLSTNASFTIFLKIPQNDLTSEHS